MSVGRTSFKKARRSKRIFGGGGGEGHAGYVSRVCSYRIVFVAHVCDVVQSWSPVRDVCDVRWTCGCEWCWFMDACVVVSVVCSSVCDVDMSRSMCGCRCDDANEHLTRSSYTYHCVLTAEYMSY